MRSSRKKDSRCIRVLKKTDKIFLAGHRGLVGSAIHRKLTSQGFDNIITRTRQDLDLMSQEAVYEFLGLPSLLF